MIHGHVIGELWSTQKVAGLEGAKLLIVRPSGGSSAERSAPADVVAVDLVGAGCGDRVLVALGRAARIATRMGDEMPIEAAIIGVVDDVNIRDEFDRGSSPAPAASTHPTRISSDVADASSDVEALQSATPETSMPSGETKSRARAARKPKEARSRPRKEKKSTPTEKTDDLFGSESPPETSSETGPRVVPSETTLEYDPVADLPGFADADEIWREVDGDENDEDRNE